MKPPRDLTTGRIRAGLFAGLLLVRFLVAPATGFAASVVFDGDPIDPATLAPYEILPGFPLVLAGPDGIFGTADDVIDAATVGDIDLVVRSGSPAAAAIIPPPIAQGGRGTLPVGVAGSSAAGGVEIPFTVFLSDGATSSTAPFGQLLAAADMEGVPVVVAAFGDLDGDGFVGLTNADVNAAADNSLEVRELEPVGRAVALFSGGVGRGSIAIQAGLPASGGGLTVALTAMAVTGSLDQDFFGGSVPTGPAIATALPFFPQRDLTRLIRERAAPAGPGTTLQPVIQFAAVPTVTADLPFALALDGSSPTIDTALVNSQPAVRVAFREDLPAPALAGSIGDLALGTQSPTDQRRLLLVPVDRWGNPSDPPPGFAVTLQAKPPLRILEPRLPPGRSELTLTSSNGLPVTVRVAPRTADGTAGVLTAERDGAIVAALSYRVDTRANRPAADVTVPSASAPTIQAAITGVSDGNGDGILAIRVSSGLYREPVLVNRSVTLQGDDAGTTILQGDGTASVLSVTAPNVTIRGLTAVGGTSGFELDSSSSLLAESRAWNNLGAGVSIAGDAAQVWRAAMTENGGDGLLVGGTDGARCAESELADNGGAGIDFSTVQNGQIEANQIVRNRIAGVSLNATNGVDLVDNQSVGNVGSGIEVFVSQGTQITGNLSAVNDEDGLHMQSTTDSLVSRNSLDSNHRFGLFLRRSTNDDFAVDPGLQGPPGDNSSGDNRKGDLFIRPK